MVLGPINVNFLRFFLSETLRPKTQTRKLKLFKEFFSMTFGPTTVYFLKISFKDLQTIKCGFLKDKIRTIRQSNKKF